MAYTVEQQQEAVARIKASMPAKDPEVVAYLEIVGAKQRLVVLKTNQVPLEMIRPGDDVFFHAAGQLKHVVNDSLKQSGVEELDDDAQTVAYLAEFEGHEVSVHDPYGDEIRAFEEAHRARALR